MGAEGDVWVTLRLQLENVDSVPACYEAAPKSGDSRASTRNSYPADLAWDYRLPSQLLPAPSAEGLSSPFLQPLVSLILWLYENKVPKLPLISFNKTAFLLIKMIIKKPFIENEHSC